MRLGCEPYHETIVYPAWYRDFHTLPAQKTLLMLHTGFYKGEICITIALNRDGLEISDENVHNESLVLRIILGES